MDILKPQSYGFTQMSSNRYCLLYEDNLYEIMFDKDGGWSLYWGNFNDYGYLPFSSCSGLSDEQFDETITSKPELLNLNRFIISYRRPIMIDEILKEL